MSITHNPHPNEYYAIKRKRYFPRSYIAQNGKCDIEKLTRRGSPPLVLKRQINPITQQEMDEIYRAFNYKGTVSGLSITGGNKFLNIKFSESKQGNYVHVKDDSIKVLGNNVLMDLYILRPMYNTSLPVVMVKNNPFNDLNNNTEYIFYDIESVASTKQDHLTDQQPRQLQESLFELYNQFVETKSNLDKDLKMLNDIDHLDKKTLLEREDYFMDALSDSDYTINTLGIVDHLSNTEHVEKRLVEEMGGVALYQIINMLNGFQNYQKKERFIKRFIKDILSGLHDEVSHDITHNDAHGGNFLINQKGKLAKIDYERALKTKGALLDKNLETQMNLWNPIDALLLYVFYNSGVLTLKKSFESLTYGEIEVIAYSYKDNNNVQYNNGIMDLVDRPSSDQPLGKILDQLLELKTFDQNDFRDLSTDEDKEQKKKELLQKLTEIINSDELKEEDIVSSQDIKKIFYDKKEYQKQEKALTLFFNRKDPTATQFACLKRKRSKNN